MRTIVSNLFLSKPPLFAGVVIVVFFSIIAQVKDASPVQFEDIYASSGLPINTPALGGSIAWGDYDGDGDSDVLIAGSVTAPSQKIRNHALNVEQSIRLWKNEGGETFKETTETTNLSRQGTFTLAIFLDYDNDGCTDIFATAEETLLHLFRNNCAGFFQDVSDAAFMDRIETRNSGPFYYHPSFATMGDYNNDGFLDIYVADRVVFSYDADHAIVGAFFPQHRLLKNNGDGTFTDTAPQAGILGLANCSNLPSVMMPMNPLWKIEGLQRQSWQPVFFDYNNDSWLDLFVTVDSGVSILFENKKDGTFQNVTEEAGLCRLGSNMGVAVGDYNNDGFLDIYTSNVGANYLWKNNGDETFSEVAAEAGIANIESVGWGVVFFDYDNDGWLDLYIANGILEGDIRRRESERKHTNYSEKLYRNNGDGTFFDASKNLDPQGNYPLRSASVTDYNGDGFLDILAESVIETFGNHNRLYKNLGNRNNWIALHLQGGVSNHDGIGARIQIKTKNSGQIRESIGASSFWSQSDPLIHFGVGSAKTIDEVRVNWPSGIVTNLKNVKVNQEIVIEERESH